jgi:hypothetical protein
VRGPCYLEEGIGIKSVKYLTTLKKKGGEPSVKSFYGFFGKVSYGLG